MQIGFNSGISGPVTRQLDQVTSTLSAAYQRLSSGLRINRAADDAAGLSIAETLRADARIYGQAVRNLNDGISLTNIQLGALEEMKNILTRQAELAEQAANGVYSAIQRKALDQEGMQLSKEYNRIVATTEFNNQKLFDQNLPQIRLAGGIGLAETLLMPATTFGQTAYSSSFDGTYLPESIYATSGHAAFSTAGDFDGDGDLDIVAGNSANNAITVFTNSGLGTFNSGVSFAGASTPISTNTGDFNGDGYDDIVTANYSAATTTVFLSNGNGTFKSATYSGGTPGYTQIDVGDLNGDGKLDYVETGGASSAFAVFINRGDGTFNNGVQYATPAVSPAIGIGDVTGDGFEDIVAANPGGYINIWANRGNGTFQVTATINGVATNSVSIGDVNLDGFNDIACSDWTSTNITVVLNNKTGGWLAPATTSIGTNSNLSELVDINGDRYLDMLLSGYGISNPVVFLNNGTGAMVNSGISFTAGSGGWGATAADVNGDGVNDIISTSWLNGVEVILGGNTNPDLPFFDLRTAAKAKQALIGTRARLTQVNLVAGGIGAIQSRIDASINNLSIRRENLINAESQIRDVDVAKETASLVRMGILQEASATLLGQANQQSGIILQLLETGQRR